jgi:hypothetical protein
LRFACIFWKSAGADIPPPPRILLSLLHQGEISKPIE